MPAPNVSVVHVFQLDIPLVGRDPTEYTWQILTLPVYFFTGAEEREIVLDGIESMSFSGKV